MNATTRGAVRAVQILKYGNSAQRSLLKRALFNTGIEKRAIGAAGIGALVGGGAGALKGLFGNWDKDIGLLGRLGRAVGYGAGGAALGGAAGALGGKAVKSLRGGGAAPRKLLSIGGEGAATKAVPALKAPVAAKAAPAVAKAVPAEGLRRTLSAAEKAQVTQKLSPAAKARQLALEKTQDAESRARLQAGLAKGRATRAAQAAPVAAKTVPAAMMPLESPERQKYIWEHLAESLRVEKIRDMARARRVVAAQGRGMPEQSLKELAANLFRPVPRRTSRG